MTITFLLSHNPNPRFTKRIGEACNYSDINLIYWDRAQKKSIPFSIDQQVNIDKLTIAAPIRNNIKRILPFIVFLPKALRKLNKRKPKIIHCGKIDMLFVSVIYKLFFNSKTSIIYEVGDLPRFISTRNKVKRFITKLYMLMEKRLCKKIDRLVLTSEYHWLTYYKSITEENKYIYIPNIPNEKYFHSFCKKNSGSFTIGFFGALRYPDQLKMLVEATKDMGIKVLIAGTGGEVDFVKNLEREYHHVSYLGAYNYSKDISELYSQVDMIYAVYDLNRENVKTALPNKLFEAINCEIPIIVAEDTELGKFVERYNIGISTPYDNLKALTNNLSKNIYEPKLNEYKLNCRKIKPMYNYDVIKKKIASLYY
ncbi:glycosyltransferase [Halobacillus massiliensis]|uniref:glycosyltransferase n=1 Tax=Halobacillus massiliensis TaxID=1926286 RepID=UPI0015C486DA|nr:glycosyltransferase [Halobacillus massiliensis]